MGYAERGNPNSQWNQKRVGHPMTHNVQMASPISNTTKTKAVTPARRQDEPMVIEITLRNMWNLLCRMLNLFKPQKTSPAPNS